MNSLELRIDLLTDELDRLHEIAWTPWSVCEFERVFAERRRLIEQWEAEQRRQNP